MILRKIVLGSVFLIAGSTALAQQPLPGTGPNPGESVVQPYRAKELLGTKVSIQGGMAMGIVDDIVFGDDGQIDYLIVNDQGRLRTVPWTSAQFDFKKRIATVNLSEQQYQTIPTYTVEQYPQFYTPDYRNQVYKWYNLTQGQQRRLERKIERQLDRR
jgi:hypothetical protein